MFVAGDGYIGATAILCAVVVSVLATRVGNDVPLHALSLACLAVGVYFTWRSRHLLSRNRPISAEMHNQMRYDLINMMR